MIFAFEELLDIVTFVILLWNLQIPSHLDYRKILTIWKTSIISNLPYIFSHFCRISVANPTAANSVQNALLDSSCQTDYIEVKKSQFENLYYYVWNWKYFSDTSRWTWTNCSYSYSSSPWTCPLCKSILWPCYKCNFCYWNYFCCDNLL